MSEILEKQRPETAETPARKGLGPLEELIRALGKLPGIGPRSARRIALHLLKKRESTMAQLTHLLASTADSVRNCLHCGNYDTQNPCWVCRDPNRDAGVICLVEDVDDLWALERSGAFKGHYHILGGTLSALAGIGPDQLRVAELLQRISQNDVREIIIALGATVEGQTTAHYLADRLTGLNINITRPAQGMPMGGELDYLDDGTLIAALKARRTIT